MIRVMIVDDQVMMVDRLKTILDLEDDIEVISTAYNGEEAVGKLSLPDAAIPDIILMDIRMPVMNGVEATRRIKEIHPEIKIIILTTFDDDEFILDAISAGAASYFLKDLPSDELINAIRQIQREMVVMQSKIMERILQSRIEKSRPKGRPVLTESLTQREREILSLMAEGYTNQDIAKALFLTEGTVKNHISNIYGKLGVHDRTQAVLLFRDSDL